MLLDEVAATGAGVGDARVPEEATVRSEHTSLFLKARALGFTSSWYHFATAALLSNRPRAVCPLRSACQRTSGRLAKAAVESPFLGATATRTVSYALRSCKLPEFLLSETRRSTVFVSFKPVVDPRRAFDEGQIKHVLYD